jgi:hypothetical protein
MNNYVLDFGRQLIDYSYLAMQTTGEKISNTWNYAASTYLGSRSIKVLEKVNKLSLHAEFFQKVAQIAIVILQGVQFYTGTLFQAKLVRVLDTANLRDFFRPWQIPYNVTHGVYEDKIDCQALVQQLRKELAEFKGLFYGNQTVRKQAEDCVMKTLGNGKAYTSIEDLKIAMKTELVQMDRSYTLFDLNNKITIELHYRPLLSRLCALSFFFVDLGCIPLYMQGWGADFSRVSNFLGQFKVFNFVNTVDLGDLVRGGVILGYGFSVAQALQTMVTSQFQANRTRALWDIAVGQAEIISNGIAMAKKWVFPALDLRIVLIATFTAKLLGALSIAFKPDEILFQQRRQPAVSQA